MTDRFMDWLEGFLDTVEGATGRSSMGGRGYASAAREGGRDDFGEFKRVIESAGSSFSHEAFSAGRTFNDLVSDSAEDLRKTILQSMIGTGWSPGTGITDLSKYTMPQVNEAIQKSGVENKALISEYRRFLSQEAGMSGYGLESALKEFTDKLMLQLQFFRLPGNQIRLMEGRDLLFYLSQIEENTRPLEGIWNVPEGMRVWVPIESTFYGEWRNKQGQAAGEEETVVTLDQGGFDASANAFGQYVGVFGDTAVKLSALDYALQTENTPLEPILAQLQGDFQWLGDVLGLAWPRTDVPQIEGTPVPPDMYYDYSLKLWEASNQYGTATQEFSTAVTSLVGPKSPLSSMLSIPAAGARPQATEPYDIYLPTIMRGIMEQLYPEVPFGPTEIELPQPFDVSIQTSEMSQAVAMGTVQTGLPISMSAMAMAVAAQASATAMQLFYLMTIAANTSQPATTTVVVEGGTTTTTTTGGGGTYTPPLMTDWYLTGVSGAVPT
jgi:hypothetical protein